MENETEKSLVLQTESACIDEWPCTKLFDLLVETTWKSVYFFSSLLNAESSTSSFY